MAQLFCLAIFTARSAASARAEPTMLKRHVGDLAGTWQPSDLAHPPSIYLAARTGNNNYSRESLSLRMYSGNT